MKQLIQLFEKSFIDLYENFNIVIPSIILSLILYGFSNLSVYVNKFFQTTFLLTLWIVAFSLVSLAAASFFLSGMIGMCKSIVGGKSSDDGFFHYSKKYWLKNLVIIGFVVILYNLIRWAAHYGALISGRIFELDVNTARVVFFLIYFAGLIGILIFFALSSFYLVLDEKGIIESIMRSVRVVRKKYIETLSALVLFFVINEIIDRFALGIWADVINGLVVLPYLTILLTRFAQNYK